MDNFFTSIPLAKSLYEKMTFITGTVRKNRKGIPRELKQQFQVGQKTYMRSDNLLFVGYREKKSQKNPVILLSSKHTAKSFEKTKRKRNENVVKQIPEIINAYNHFMGGVDGNDQMMYCYLDERRTLKYWKKVTFNIFARMILNAYIIYSENTSGKAMSRYHFTISIIEALSAQWYRERDAGKTAQNNGGGGDGPGNNPQTGLKSLPGKQERNCCVCSPLSTKAGGKRKKSRTVCVKCGKGLHGVCFGQHKCS